MSASSLSLLLLIAVFFFPSDAFANDNAEELNCLICHKHRGLSRIDEDGNFRLFYINNELYQAGPHRRNQCKDCHTDIDRIPHKETKKVDCTQECHSVEPSEQEQFSHKSVAETLAHSVHGKLDENNQLKEHQDDYPDCKDCHDQPLYRPVSLFKGASMPGISERSISRCKSCHTSGNFADDFYEHITARLHKGRFPMETVEVCAKCHQDEEFRQRHDLDDVVTSYKETFHAKLMILGSEKTADCLDCHVVQGENTHMIESQKIPTSAVHDSNIANTCRSSGCHEEAGEMLASYQTHVTYDKDKYPLQFYMLLFFKSLMGMVMYFFLILIFFELLRRLFPKFTFIKNKNTSKSSLDKDAIE